MKAHQMEISLATFRVSAGPLFILYLLVGGLWPGAALQAASPKQMETWRQDASFHPELTEQDRESLIRNLEPWSAGKSIRPANTLPSSQINHLYLPAVRSQESQNCVTFAMCYYYRTWQEAREHGWVHPDPDLNPGQVMNPKFVSRLGGLYDLLKVLGCASFEAMEIGWDTEQNLPLESCYDDARLHRARSYYTLPEDDTLAMDALKQHLVDGDLAHVSLLNSDNFASYHGGTGDGYDNDVFFAYRGSCGIGHALTVIGYDDDKAYNADGEARQGAFLLVNSWGQDWGWTLPEVGTAGFIWIGYDFFTANMLNNIVVMEDRPSVDDTNFAYVRLEHDRIPELNWQLIGGSPQFPTGAYSLGSLFGLASRDGFFKFGIDDLVGGIAGGGAVRMQVYDMDLGYAFGDSKSYTGVIKAFWISQNGVASDWVAERNLPVSTMDANMSDMEDLAEKTLIWDLRVVEEEYLDIFTVGTTLRKQLFCADFDGDGDEDLLGGCIWLLKVNDGSGNFSQVDLSLGFKMYVQDVADFNNDGLLDLLVMDLDQANFLIYYGTREAARFVDSGIRFEAPNGPLHADVVDFNGDGLPDVSTREKPVYVFPPNPTTFRVWINSGQGSFTDSGLRLPQVDNSRWGFAAWGDYDNDGLPDLALAAGLYTTYTSPRLYILHNNGDGTLAEAGSFVFTVEGEGLRWADMTGDGLLDLIVTDRDELVILRNAGDGVFEKMTHNLQGLTNVVSLAVGDADNDGLADLALQGIRTETNNGLVKTDAHTGLFFNRGTGNFIWATGPSEILLQDTAVALGDFDADGDLDMCAYGNHDMGGSDFPGGIVPSLRMEFFKNLAANERLNRPNAPPMAPVVTWSGYDPLQHTVTIKWRANADDHTPGPQLGWRVRLGTRPGRGDLIGAAFNSERPVQVHPLPDGNGVCTLSYNNFDLNQATYVSVQAVDEGLASSTWSGAYELLPADASSIYDVNEDGLIDVADLLSLQSILNDNKVNPDPRADLNGDSAVTLLDRTMMIDYLIARLSFDSAVMDLIPVGPTATTVKYDRLELDFPLALNNQGHTVVLMPSNADAPYDNMLAETFYRLDGMPAQRDVPITVRMFAPGADPQTTRLLFGQQVTPTSIWEPIKSWLAIAPDSSSGDWLTFTIPASLQSNLRLKTQTVKATEQAPVRQASYSREPLTNWIGLATGIIRMESDHFYVDYPQAVPTAEINAMMDGLEWAYTNLKDVYGFNFTEYMNWPAKVPINVINLRGGVYNSVKKYITGQEVAVAYGYFDPILGYIAINQTDISGTATNSTHVLAAVHEFCHMVISRFRPLFSPPEGGFEYNVDWLDEATAVWFESVYNNWISPAVFDENITKPFKWGMLGNLASTSAESYGYGMASLISYFTDIQVNDQFPRQLWSNLQGGKNTLASIRAASGESGNDWWTDFMQSLATSRIYPFGWMDVETAVGANIIDMADFTISDMDFSRSKSFSMAHIEDLSSRLFQITLDKTKNTNDLMLSMRMEVTGSRMDLTAIRFEKPASLEPRAEGTLAGELIKLDLPLTGIIGSHETFILPLITVPDDHIGNYCGSFDYRGLGSTTCHPRYGTASLKVAFTRDRVWNLPTPNLAQNGPYGFYTIESVVSVQGPGLADVEFISNSPSAGQMLYAQSMGVPPIDFTINVSSNFQTTEHISGSITYTAGPIKFYRLRYTPENFDDPEQITDSATGVLTLHQSTTSKYLLGKIYAVYDVTCTSGEETTVIYDHETLVSMVTLLP